MHFLGHLRRLRRQGISTGPRRPICDAVDLGIGHTSFTKSSASSRATWSAAGGAGPAACARRTPRWRRGCDIGHGGRFHALAANCMLAARGSWGSHPDIVPEPGLPRAMRQRGLGLGERPPRGRNACSAMDRASRRTPAMASDDLARQDVRSRLFKEVRIEAASPVKNSCRRRRLTTQWPPTLRATGSAPVFSRW